MSSENNIDSEGGRSTVISSSPSNVPSHTTPTSKIVFSIEGSNGVKKIGSVLLEIISHNNFINVEEEKMIRGVVLCWSRIPVQNVRQKWTRKGHEKTQLSDRGVSQGDRKILRGGG